MTGNGGFIGPAKPGDDTVPVKLAPGELDVTIDGKTTRHDLADLAPARCRCAAGVEGELDYAGLRCACALACQARAHGRGD